MGKEANWTEMLANESFIEVIFALMLDKKREVIFVSLGQKVHYYWCTTSFWVMT